MTEPLFAGSTLARRLEHAEAGDMEACVAERRRRDPASDAACLPIAGGSAVFFGVGSPLTQAVGLGIEREVSSAEVDQLVDFYGSRGATPQVLLCPLADPSLVARLGERGFRVAEMETTLVRPLAGATFPPHRAIDVRRTDDESTWVDVVLRGFAPPPEHVAIGIDISRALFEIPGAAAFLAMSGGKLAGGALLTVRDGVAQLFGASTSPSFRRRGVQSAMLSARLSLAVSMGADMARVTTAPGSGSQRNAERAGFQVAWTRPTMVLAR